MPQYTERIEEIRVKLEKAKDARIRAEARLEQLQRQKDEILKELEQLGVEPGNIEKEIGILRAEIENALDKTGQLLPNEIK